MTLASFLQGVARLHDANPRCFELGLVAQRFRILRFVEPIELGDGNFELLGFFPQAPPVVFNVGQL